MNKKELIKIILNGENDRVEISSGLPKGLSPEDFGKVSVQRNPLIASLLLRANYIEKMGTGIKRIKNTLMKAGNPKPSFSYKGFFIITFKRKNAPVNAPINISDTQVKILLEIKANPYITYDEIVKLINKSRSIVVRNISQLKDREKIKRVGGRKTGYWEVIDKKQIKKGEKKL